MKYKIYEVLLICLIIFSITACSSNHDKQTTEITDEKSYFEATVLEKTDNAILVEPSEMAQERKSSDKIWININNIAEEKSLEVLRDLDIGDIVAIGYLGGIAESYPAQINDVYEIALVEKGKYPQMVIVDGKLYRGTGEESDIGPRCGTMDGEITASVDITEIPSEDRQSNFGTGYGYQYVSEGSIDVYMPDGNEELKWMRFVTEISDFPEATATTEALTNIDTLEGISIEVVHVTNQGIKLSFLNKTDKTIEFGDNYLLEMKQDEKWYGVDYIIKNWGFNSIAYVVQKDIPMNWDTDWTQFHGVLPQGIYRIVKPVMDFRGTGDFTTYNLAVEFTVQ